MPKTPPKFRKQKGKRIGNNNNNSTKNPHTNKYKNTGQIGNKKSKYAKKKWNEETYLPQQSRTTTPKTPYEIKSNIEQQVYSEYARGFKFLSPKEQIRISKQIEKEVNKRIHIYFSRKKKN